MKKGRGRREGEEEEGMRKEKIQTRKIDGIGVEEEGQKENDEG